MTDLTCPYCGRPLVEVDNPMRREVRHRRGEEAACPGPPSTRRRIPTPAEMVAGLRTAASLLTTDSTAAIGLPIPAPDQHAPDAEVQLLLPAEIAHAVRQILLAAAAEIEAHGRALGLPVNYPLQIAGAILGEDLGHNR